MVPSFVIIFLSFCEIQTNETIFENFEFFEKIKKITSAASRLPKVIYNNALNKHASKLVGFNCVTFF